MRALRALEEAGPENIGAAAARLVADALANLRTEGTTRCTGSRWRPCPLGTRMPSASWPSSSPTRPRERRSREATAGRGGRRLTRSRLLRYPSVAPKGVARHTMRAWGALLRSLRAPLESSLRRGDAGLDRATVPTRRCRSLGLASPSLRPLKSAHVFMSNADHRTVGPTQRLHPRICPHRDLPVTPLLRWRVRTGMAAQH